MYSQTNNLSASPYSLFGLGVPTKANVGSQVSLGGSGIGSLDFTSINLTNPAAFSNIKERQFFFDFGMLAQINDLDDGKDNEDRVAANFSNLALAFSTGQHAGFGLSMLPKSDVGYILIGLEGVIEGSSETFDNNVFGSGGINEIRLNYGIALNQALSIGFTSSYLFGTIDQTEQINIGNEFQTSTSLVVEQQNKYAGFSVGFGTQFKINDKITLGGTFNSGAKLKGNQDRVVSKVLDFEPALVENFEQEPIDDFIIPIKLGTGISLKTSERSYLNLDYTIDLWNSTNQEDNIGVFTNQHIAAIGFKYQGRQRPYKFIKRFDYSAGFYYDSGYLKIQDQSIESAAFSLGVGIPLGYGGSKLNIGYSFTSSGVADGLLIQENTHLINLNLSLGQLWFQKRKYD